MFELDGRIVMVAGGAGYLGREICARLAAQGATVVAADRAADRAAALAGELGAAGHRVQALALDVADEGSIAGALERIRADHGRLDGLVSAVCSTARPGATVDDLTGEEFDRANRINLTGTFLLVRGAAGLMERGGSVVLFASMYGKVAPDPRMYEAPMRPNPIEYGVGKAGVIQMARYLAVCWAARGIRVNAVAPGPFPAPAVREDRGFVQRLEGKAPLGRVGRREEIGGVVVFLLSEASSYMTGTVVDIDGGWTAW
ncbi:MAG: SDR family oxidoreductase [Lentisphaerae bacterium]|nr:SDR family oxidoreductase [Lentisphaerota bacterium]